MQSEGRPCPHCGGILTASSELRGQVRGVCASCGVAVDASGLSEFTQRLARFGLGSTGAPLLKALPELPDAK